MTSDYATKLVTVWDSLPTGRSDGALARIITPLGAREAETSADERLKDFMVELPPTLDRFVPGARDAAEIR